MSVETVLVTIEKSALAALKAAGHIVEGIVISEVQTLVARLKETPLGTAVMNTVELLEETGKSGPDKFAELVEKQGPALAKAVNDAGGLHGLGITLESLGAEFFNSVVNDFKAAVAKA